MEYSDPVLAYLAGVIDSDGSIGVRKSTYAMRVRKDATRAVYSERIDCKQVQPQAVELLKATLGGGVYVERASLKSGRPFYAWHVHSAAAGRALISLRPYLRIKTAQADNAIALRALIAQGRRYTVPPIVDGEELIPASEFARRLNVQPETVLQACRLGSVPSRRVGRYRMMPASFLPNYRRRMSKKAGGPPRSDEMESEMDALYRRAKELNRVGV